MSEKLREAEMREAIRRYRHELDCCLCDTCLDKCREDDGLFSGSSDEEPCMACWINDLIRENERLRHAASWQPIDSAPIDGTIVLLLRDSAPEGVSSSRVVIGAWWPYAGSWAWPAGPCDEYDPEVWWAEVEEDHYCDEAFTHWMPLQRPPEESHDL